MCVFRVLRVLCVIVVCCCVSNVRMLCVVVFFELFL